MPWSYGSIDGYSWTIELTSNGNWHHFRVSATAAPGRMPRAPLAQPGVVSVALDDT
jgi:hypothetical protein